MYKKLVSKVQTENLRCSVIIVGFEAVRGYCSSTADSATEADSKGRCRNTTFITFLLQRNFLVLEFVIC